LEIYESYPGLDIRHLLAPTFLELGSGTGFSKSSIGAGLLSYLMEPT